MNATCTLMMSLMLVALAPTVHAQDTSADTLRHYTLDAVVVTADRAAQAVASTAASVSVLSAEDLEALPVTNLAEALATLPGLVFFNRDGTGRDPIANVRGFYGGGEVSYLQVLVDGRSINDVETGLVNWNAVSLAQVERIEVLRGGSSALYGDAAIGGVIHIITRKTPGTRLAGSYGTFNAFNVQGNTQGSVLGHRYSVYADHDQTDGYRNHGARTITNLGGTFDVFDSETFTLGLSTAHHWASVEDPGTLSSFELADGSTGTSPLFRFDEGDERRHRGGLEAAWHPNAATSMTAYVDGSYRASDVIRTLVLFPGFADTKNRDLSTSHVQGGVQWTYTGLPLPVPHRLQVGADVGVGSMDSQYYTYMLGSIRDYATIPGRTRGDLNAEGTGDRTTLAAYMQLEAQPIDALRLTAGARVDQLTDTFLPASIGGSAQQQEQSHTAFSPRFGVNLRYAQTPSHTGHVYATVSQSFKAPTLDQRYDQRSIPIASPPFQITLSNALLDPQTGTNLEVGLYHQLLLANNTLGELSVSIYQMDMKDEIDFDFQTFGYANISESRHRGIELGLKVYYDRHLTAFANYTYQAATIADGPTEGNFLKAIPRDVVSGGLQYSAPQGAGFGLFVKSVNNTYLDDANTLTLDDYVTLDARVSYRLRFATAALEVFNLTDTAYSTTGFPLPDLEGNSVLYFYPAAGRSVRLGLQIDL